MKRRAAATWAFVGNCGKMEATQLCPMLLLCLALVRCSLAFPLCSNLDAPRPQKSSLKFCSAPEYRSNGCCDASQDASLSQEFQSLNGTSSECAALVQQILCARCDQFAAELFGVGEQPGRSVPYLCNSGSSPYCAAVWDACGNQPLPSSLFSRSGPLQQVAGVSAASVQESTAALSSLFQNATDFCTSFGPPQDSPLGDVCFSGGPYQLPLPSAASQAAPGPPGAICLDKLDTGAYLNLIPHPDRSDRAFLAAQSGQIWLASIPANQPPGAKAAQATIGVNRSEPPFLDLSDRVVNEGESGLLGLAFHPNFLANGRFFVSYICDKLQWADCGGKCACYSDVGCNPSDLGSLAGPFPCRFSSVIAEYSANATAPSPAGRAEAREVRRIFTLGLPYPNHHGGQILFGPLDGYLYYMIGDGGNAGDPWNFAQNKNSLLGKIHRLDVDNLPSEQEIQEQGLWGNYSIPPTNPLVGDGNARPEIWALGLRNPWRCSFDSRNPLYFYCGDVGQDMYEEVDLISRGGNYGWRVLEGNAAFNASWAPGGSTKPGAQVGPLIPPILVYSHSSNVSAPRAASITGGYVSRSTLDPCTYGRYVYADLYGLVWVATETPDGGGNYSTSAISYQCAPSSPLPCDVGSGSGAPPLLPPSLQPIYSFAEDARRDMFLLTDGGVYRVTNPAKCSLVCDSALPPYASPDLAPSPGSHPNSASRPPAPLEPALASLMLLTLLCSQLFQL